MTPNPKTATAEIRKIRRIEEKYQATKEERRSAIVEAVESGVPALALAEATGLSQSAIYKIVSRATSKSATVHVGR